MQDHNSYVLDTVKIFGKILDHNDDIPDDKLQKYTRETHYLSNKIKYAERKDSTCVVALASVSIKYNSSCGSGCGGHTSCGEVVVVVAVVEEVVIKINLLF